MGRTKVLWFTGLSGSGKSTISFKLIEHLKSKGKSYLVLDGDDVRERLHKHLGFKREDILENNRLILNLCKENFGNVEIILVPVISPFRVSREAGKKEFGEDFVEIYLDCPYEVCKKRDVKGLYKKAENGEIENFIGLHHPYETPENPTIKLDVVNKTAEECAREVIEFLKL